MSIPKWMRLEMNKKGLTNAPTLHLSMRFKRFIISAPSVSNHLAGRSTPSARSLADYEKFFGSKYPGD